MSNYYKWGVHVDKLHADPQFWGARNVTSHKLSIPVLTKVIDNTLLHWRHNSRSPWRCIERAGRSSSCLASGTVRRRGRIIRRLRIRQRSRHEHGAALTASCGGRRAESCTLEGSGSCRQIARQTTKRLLSDYATNYNAVLRSFNKQRYPRWSSPLPTEAS